MDFDFSERTQRYQAQLKDFMAEHVYPAEKVFERQLNEAPTRWQIPPIMEELKAKARVRSCGTLFLPESDLGAGLTNLEYAPLCEIMGRSSMAPEVFNCSAPDTGNMETLVRYATPAQQEEWLKPLLAGEIRSSFAMTEPAVASSDATNIEARIERDGNQGYVVNARKWWTSGAMDPRCKIIILMGKTDPTAPRHQQQSMILVPRDTPGVTVVRPLTVFGYDDAPHGHAEVEFKDVRVPAENILLGEGRGFEIAQGRLGPGRIHHCMRMIGLAERSLEAMVARVKSRTAFGRPLADQGVIREWIADSRMEIEQSRLLTLKAAHMMDTVGNKVAQAEIAMIKVIAPKMLLAVIDRAIQAHGGGGVSQDFGLAYAWARSRVMRIVDGPDEASPGRGAGRVAEVIGAGIGHGASFETPAARAPQDEDGLGMPSTLTTLMPRTIIPHPGGAPDRERLEGRTTPMQSPTSRLEAAETIDERPDERVDTARLIPYLRERLGVSGDIAIRQFGGGKANLTYLIRFGSDEYVLRRPPLGPIPPGAHDMRREHRVLSRLYRQFNLAPRSLLLCEDESIIGARVFIVLERRHGFVVREATCPTSSPANRPELNGRIGFPRWLMRSPICTGSRRPKRGSTRSGGPSITSNASSKAGRGAGTARRADRRPRTPGRLFAPVLAWLAANLPGSRARRRCCTTITGFDNCLLDTADPGPHGRGDGLGHVHPGRSARRSRLCAELLGRAGRRPGVAGDRVDADLARGVSAPRRGDRALCRAHRV